MVRQGLGRLSLVFRSYIIDQSAVPLFGRDNSFKNYELGVMNDELKKTNPE